MNTATLRRIATARPEIVAAASATVSLAVLFGAPITKEQLAGIGLALGAWLVALGRLVTPTADVALTHAQAEEIKALPVTQRAELATEDDPELADFLNGLLES